jgi:protein tyrosine phosphatase (PTP) superfamily phosphohydrolase (DUF442 family)
MMRAEKESVFMRASLSMAFAAALSASLVAQQVTKETVPGVTNFARLQTTVACGGATKAEAVPELKKMGFASIINLRLASEQGANVEEEAAAAKASGIKYFHLPFNTTGEQSEREHVADEFLKTLTTPGNEPAYIHCASANRAAAMWMIKRIAIDHWDADRAGTEAAGLGLTNANLKQFAVDYAQAHKK